MDLLVSVKFLTVLKVSYDSMKSVSTMCTLLPDLYANTYSLRSETAGALKF